MIHNGGELPAPGRLEYRASDCAHGATDPDGSVKVDGHGSVPTIERKKERKKFRHRGFVLLSFTLLR